MSYNRKRLIFIFLLLLQHCVAISETNVTESANKEEGTKELSLSTAQPKGDDDDDLQNVSEDISSGMTIAFVKSVTESIATSVLEATEDDSGVSEKVSSFGIASTTEATFNNEHTFAVYDAKDKICLLARFHATITISKTGEETIPIHLPNNARSGGQCGEDVKNPMLKLTWSDFILTITFSKVSDEDNYSGEWAVTAIEFHYDTSTPLIGGNNVGKITARSKNIEVLKTDFGRSFVCPETELISLYSSNKKVMSIQMSQVQLQPFDIEDGKFSKSQRCNQVVISGPEEPFFQEETDETVPLAVGLTLTILTLILVLGFSVHRAYTMRKVDYNSME